METDIVYRSLLRTLDESPMWTWDAPPALWAVISEEPAIVTPVVSVATTGHMVALARAWREQVGSPVPVDHLILINEGWEVQGEDRKEVRDAVGVAKDGSTVFLRHYRESGEVTEMDCVMSATDGLNAIREVGAAAWS